MQFYSFGFYDSLTCVKPKEITSMAYQEHFLISYPFEKTAKTSKVEQWFALFPLAEEKRCCIGVILNENEDLFFCRKELQVELPFIGVILISLSNKLNKKQAMGFKELLADYVEKMVAIFEKISQDFVEKRYVMEIYYSLNCSDLCIAIRTDEIPFIHHVNYTLKQKAYESNYAINSTVIFAVQDTVDAKILHDVAEKNKKVSFIVRSNEKYNEKSKGVNGTGRYVTQFEYKEYIRFLPQLVQYKIGKEGDLFEQIEPFVKSICHEREWFIEEEGQSESLSAKDEKSELQKAVCGWIKDIHDEIIEIERLATNIFSKSKNLYGYIDILAREMRLVKDLVYSYSDLWYQNASDSGFIFFAQLMIALQGMKGLLREIDNVDSGDELLELSIERFTEVMHCVVCDLNGYNRQFQFLNQDSVNFPSYEIQSKVNAGKYMSAYNSFMHKFFVLYYQEKGEDKHIFQNFPLALVDLKERKIIANLFFSELYKRNTKAKNKNVRGIFAVHFPSSEYFSNLWNSIPLLMHEISHTLYFGETVDRNRAIIYNIDAYMAEILTEKMLEYVNGGIVVHTSALLSEIFKKVVYKAITLLREKFFDKRGGFENWGFKQLLENCREFYFSILGKRDNRKNITYSQLNALENQAKKDIDYIMQAIGFPTMCYAFNRRIDSPPSIYYFINVLYLEFNPKFYHDYEMAYDKDFLKKLVEEVRRETKESIQQELLLCALYRFLKYVKHDKGKISDYPEIVEENMSESLVITFMMVLITGMRAIYEKYNGKFDAKVSEAEYYNELIPNVVNWNILEYTTLLKDAYERYQSEKCDKKDSSIHDVNLMRAMLYEYYELYVSVNNIVSFLEEREQYLSDECIENNACEFVRCIHSEGRKYVHEEEGKDSFHAIFTETNRELLVKLGFMEKYSATLEEIYARVCAESSASFVEDVMGNRRELFMEVYADCGMCCAMNFDPFGYCMFAMSIYKLVNDLGTMNPNSNFLADRICSVVRMFFTDENENIWGDIFRKFLCKLCDVRMVDSICVMLTSIGDRQEVAEIHNELKLFMDEPFECDNDELERLLKTKYNDILIDWRDDIIGKLIDVIVEQYNSVNDIMLEDKVSVARAYLLRVYNVLQIFLQEEVLSHILLDNFDGFFQGVRRYIEASAGIKAVREDACVKEIGRFYNMDSPEGVDDKFEWYYHTYCDGFLTQCNFIFDNYCDYRNAYDNLRSQIKVNHQGEVNLKIIQWFEKIDDYYRREVK